MRLQSLWRRFRFLGKFSDGPWNSASKPWGKYPYDNVTRWRCCELRNRLLKEIERERKTFDAEDLKRRNQEFLGKSA